MNDNKPNDAKTPTNGGDQRFRLVGWMVGVFILLLAAIVFAAHIDKIDTRKTLLDKILDWPVLGFSIAMMLFGALGREVLELIRTRNIKVGSFLEVGDKINAVEAETDEMGATLAYQIEALETAVFHRQVPNSTLPSPDLPNADSAPPEPIVPASAPSAEPVSSHETTAKASARETNTEMFERLYSSLANSRFEWRSVERLAIENGL